MTRWAPIASNIVLAHALWTLAVCGAGTTWWWAAPALILISAIVQLRWSPAPAAECMFVFVGGFAGMLLDMASNALGLFNYASSSQIEFVVVFASLWINFGTTLRPSLRWLWRRRVLAAILGGVCGPLTYWAAARIGAISPTEPAWRVFAWCGMQYAVALPLWGSAAWLLFRDVPRPTLPRTSIARPPRSGTPVS